SAAPGRAHPALLRSRRLRALDPLEVGREEKRRRDLVDDALAAPLDRAAAPLGEAALGGHRGPALVERVDGNAGGLAERAREAARGLRLRTGAPAHVQRQADDRAADRALAHQR